MTIDARAARAVVLIAWCVFLSWLWLTGEVARYLGPRTDWVVPLGAIALVAATASYCRANSAGRLAFGRLAASEALGLVGMLLPIIAGAVLAHAQLGALAASKKLSQRGIDPSALADLASTNPTEDGFVQITVAGRNSDFAKRTGLTNGRTVRLAGFVARSPRGPHHRFELARFYITCCVADAVPIGLPVEPAGSGHASYGKDDWLDVTASLAQHGRSYVLLARRVRHISPPKHPYLSFSS